MEQSLEIYLKRPFSEVGNEKGTRVAITYTIEASVPGLRAKNRLTRLLSTEEIATKTDAKFLLTTTAKLALSAAEPLSFCFRGT